MESHNSITNQVYWYTLRIPKEKVLTENDEADVVIVGGGMAGLTAAQKLSERGQTVILVEREFCGAGASGKSSGFITPESELGLQGLLSRFTPEQSKMLWEFALDGTRHIRKTIDRFGLVCDYQIQDCLYIANSARAFRTVAEEHKARETLGYPSKLYTGNNLSSVISSPHYYGAMRYPDTFSIISYLYCQGLKEALQKQGVKIYERTPVTAIRNKEVAAGPFRITARRIIICTDRFLPELGIIKDHVYSAQTFLTISKPLNDDQIQLIFPNGPCMVWDTDLTYQYYRLTGDKRLLFGAETLLYTYAPRERHNSRLITRKMHRYISQKFPKLNIQFEYLWPGLIGVSKDFLPLAGQHPTLSNVYYIGGAAGLPWAAALGGYMADKVIDERTSPLDAYFTAERRYPIGKTIQRIVRKPLAFALSHGITEYFD